MLNNLNSRGFRASSLSTNDFFNIYSEYTALSHNLIKDKLMDLIEIIFQREALFVLHVMIGVLSLPMMQSQL